MSMLRPALVSFGSLTLLAGLVYPLAVTCAARASMPSKSSGSLIVRDKTVLGSRLIGQASEDPAFFWSRPSATMDKPYNAAGSGGSNLSAGNAGLRERAQARIEALRAADPGNTAIIPVDLVTASASGLDPHISPAAAEYQLARVARHRGLDPQAVREMVRRHTQAPLLGFLGEPVVNVLELNLELGGIPSTDPQPVQPALAKAR